MNSDVVALDTNQVIHLLNNLHDSGRWIRQFSQVYLPAPVMGELIFGAMKSQRPKENLARLENLFARCHFLRIDEGTCKEYARVQLELQLKGKPVPTNDVWIAALCIQHQMPLASSDLHFLNVDGRKWLRR